MTSNDDEPTPAELSIPLFDGSAFTEEIDQTPRVGVEPSVEAPVIFERQMLARTVMWVWLAGYLIGVLIVTVAVLQIDIFVIPFRTGIVSATTAIAGIGSAVWRTVTRYRRWSWELDETQLVIDRGVVFRLTKVVPRVRVQHVDLSSGPLDRFFGLRQISIYTAGTREADASIPGLAADTAEALRRALIER